jgi:hypothetical protein
MRYNVHNNNDNGTDNQSIKGGTTMKKITITQDAYINGGSVRAGGNSPYELTAWYEAEAEDADGNEYRVIWTIDNPDAEDQSDACDWENPWAIIHLDTGRDVTDQCEIIW